MHFFLASLLLTGCGWFSSRADGPVEHEGRPSNGRVKPEKPDKRERGGGGEGGKLLPTEIFVPQEAPCGPWKRPGAYLYPFMYEGERTEVALFIGDSGPTRDLVFALHGGGGGAASILKQSRFHTKAREEGFVTVAPQGRTLSEIGTRWNTGKFDGKTDEHLRPGEEMRDDVDYLDKLAKALRRDLCASSVTAVGFSSGGQMTHTWACKGEEVDAIVSAAGELLVGDYTCGRQVPVLGLVGTRDDVYTRGPDENDPTQPSAPETVRMWAKTNGCSKTAPVESRVDDATCFTYQDCKVPTQLCVIDGLPHAYPAPWGTDGKSSKFNATEYGWNWKKTLR
jgi:poly(3-hydroxybutyrate) depolymerase